MRIINMNRKLLVWLFFLAFWWGNSLAWASVDEELFRKIESNLMCYDGCGMYLPACENAAAKSMRTEIREMLMEGRTEGEIYSYFINIYGPEVMASPPGDNPLNILAWLLPFLSIGGGGFLIYFVVKQWTQNHSQNPEEILEETPAQYQEALDERLREFY